MQFVAMVTRNYHFKSLTFINIVLRPILQVFSYLCLNVAKLQLCRTVPCLVNAKTILDKSSWTGLKKRAKISTNLCQLLSTCVHCAIVGYISISECPPLPPANVVFFGSNLGGKKQH